MATIGLNHDVSGRRDLSSAAAWVGLAGWLLLTFAALGVGALYPADDWYARLAKPSWTPPGWLFPPVWAALYILMGVAAWLVWWQDGSTAAASALGLFVAQLGVNAAWSPLFFGLHRPDLALLDIVALNILIAMTIVAFWRHHRAAAVMLVPYLLWVAFATTLNFGVWRMNP